MPKAAALACVLVGLAAPVRAGVGVAWLQQVRAKLAKIRASAPGREAQRLLDEGEKAHQNNRHGLCPNAVQRAAALIR